jgi:hypothetical protein
MNLVSKQLQGGRVHLVRKMGNDAICPKLIPECKKQGMRLRGGMPNVGMENWTSDFDRRCWNESNPDIMSPLFVPKVISRSEVEEMKERCYDIFPV